MRVCIRSYCIGAVETFFKCEANLSYKLAEKYLKACETLNYAGDSKVMVFIGLEFPELINI